MRVVMRGFLSALVFAFVSRSFASPVVLSVSDTSTASAHATVTGRFTPTSYVPAFSSIFITLSGANVFPTGSVSKPTTVSVSGQSSADDKLRWERFNNVVHEPSYREGLFSNTDYAANSPQQLYFRSLISFDAQNDDHFAWRATGAFCPTISGQYQFVLEGVDDMMELNIARDDSTSFEQVMAVALSATNTEFPVTVDYTMEAAHRYRFILLYVENQQNDYLHFKWRAPGSSDVVEIPPSAFCAGWSNFNLGVLRIDFSWALQSGSEVTFTIMTLPSPLCPRVANTQVSSAIVVPQIALVNAVSGTLAASSSGLYPAFSASPLLLTMSLGKFDNTRVLNITITPLGVLSSVNAFVITLAGTGLFFTGNYVSFISPFGIAASASVSEPSIVLTVVIPVTSFPPQTPVIFTIGNVSSAHTSSGLNNIAAAATSSTGACLAQTSSGSFPAVPRSSWVFICGSSANAWSC
jgi:hypothetical protein